MFAGRRGTVGDVPLPDANTLSACSDEELAELAADVADEQRRRALAAGDLDTVVEQGFAEGFDAKGAASDPWVVGHLLVCPGSKVDRSSASHECRFVHLGGSWIWESAEKVVDEVRRLPGPRPSVRTVTVVVATEGLELDVVASRLRSGVHQMTSVRSYVVRRGELELVSTRAREASGHR